MIPWNDIKSEFEADGSLRDIYILSTDTDDWNRVLDVLRSRYELECHLDHEPHDIPASSNKAFDLTENASLLLIVKLSGGEANCHFFCPQIIEFDIDPRQVRSQADFDSILDFVQAIGDATAKAVVVTQENALDEVIFDYNPIQRVFRHRKNISR